MEKKVSIGNIDKILKYHKYENKVITYKCGDEDIEVCVDCAIGYEKWVEAISIATRAIVKEDKYTPQIISIVFGTALIIGFTNIKTDNIVKIFNLVTQTDIIEKIKEVLPDSVYESFVSDFDNSLLYACNNITPRSKFFSEINGLIDGLNNQEVIDNIIQYDKLNSGGMSGQ